MRYSQSATELQGLEREYGDNLNAGPADDPIDLGVPGNALNARILTACDDDFKPSPPRETSAFRKKVASARSESYILQGIIQEWLKSCYSAEHAIDALMNCGLLTERLMADPYEEMASIAYVVFGPVALPEPGSAPVPSVSSGQPFRPVTEGGAV